MTAPVRRTGHQRYILASALLITVVGALVIAFIPQQGTDARWRNTTTVQAPGLSMDKLTLTSTADTTSTAFPGLTVKNASNRTTGYWKPDSLTINPWPGSGTTVAETTYYAQESYWAFFVNAPANCANTVMGTEAYHYSVGNTITSGVKETIFPLQSRADRYKLTPGQSSHTCVRLNYGYSEYDRIYYYAGRAFSISMTSDQISEAPATWRSAPSSAAMKLSVPFPQPKEPGDRYTCINPPGGKLPYMQWAWFNPNDVPDAGPASINRWEVQRRLPNGAWTTLTSTTDSSSDVYSFAYSDVPDFAGASADFRVVAYPYAGTQYYARSTFTATLTRPSAGRFPQCTSVQLSTEPNPVVMP